MGFQVSKIKNKISLIKWEQRGRKEGIQFYEVNLGSRVYKRKRGGRNREIHTLNEVGPGAALVAYSVSTTLPRPASSSSIHRPTLLPHSFLSSAQISAFSFASHGYNLSIQVFSSTFSSFSSSLYPQILKLINTCPNIFAFSLLSLSTRLPFSQFPLYFSCFCCNYGAFSFLIFISLQISQMAMIFHTIASFSNFVHAYSDTFLVFLV